MVELIVQLLKYSSFRIGMHAMMDMSFAEANEHGRYVHSERDRSVEYA